jgi:SAM-dependent methyltransferase
MQVTDDMAVDAECVVCGSGVGDVEHRVDEAMFRTGESFIYRECSRCGSLRISKVPDDLASYYDKDRYYSFSTQNRIVGKHWLRYPPVRLALRLNTAIYIRTGLGRGVPWARHAGIGVNDRLLDLGCGSGEQLLNLWKYGYRHLIGADPFLSEDRELVPEVPLLKRYHHDLEGEFDWITMHHSFEHVPDPRGVLRSIYSRLAPDGRALIRMPIMGSNAWRTYGTDWVQIDAPRHLGLYTLDAMRKMASSEGFTVERVIFDSTDFQFWGSELVAAGRPHIDGPVGFSAKQIEGWSDAAQRLNLNDDGDQAGFVLRRV